MWTRALLCVFAIAVASASNGWESGKKYTYQVRGRTLTALHEVADQYVGIVTKAQLDIVAKSESQLIASLREAQFAKVQKNLPGGWGSSIGDEQLSYEPLPVSSKPIEIRVEGGVIEEVIVDASLPTWEINMMKGIFSQLQMDIKGKHLLHSPENQLPSADNRNGVFKTMEPSVTGRCEVQYDISALPEYVLQSRPELAPLPELRKDGEFIDVVKSTNFSHCANRPVYNFGFPGLQDLDIGSSQMGDAIARSSVSRAVLSGNLNKYTIQSSVTTQKIIISPNLYNNQKGMIVSRMNVTLTKVDKASEQAAGPENPRHLNDLVYILRKSLVDSLSAEQQDSNEEHSDPRMNSNAARRFRNSLKNQRPSEDQEANWSQELKTEYKHKSQFDEPRQFAIVFSSAVEKKLANPVRSSISLAKQIAEDLQNPSDIPEKATLSKFNTLCLVARAMNTKQIQDVVHELYVPASHSEPSRDTLIQRAAWKAWRDAVAQAGTGPALVNMKEWIEKNMVHGMEAAHMITSLPSAARYPDKEYIHFLFRLAENPQVKKDHSVYTAALFSLTTLLRRAHVEKNTSMSRYPAYVFGRLNPMDETRVDRYVDFYAYRLKKAVEEGDSVKIQTFTAILGNIGHPRVLKALEPYLEGEKTVTPYQRRFMISILHNMAGAHPRLVRLTAYRVYQSANEDAQSRSLAAYIVMDTNPPASMIQRMAESTQFEENEQVRSAVKTIIESHANLKAGEDWEKISNARAGVKNLNGTHTSIHYSQGRRFSKDLEDMQMALSGFLYTIGSEDSLFPHTMFTGYQKSFNGIKMPVNSLSVTASSIQNIWERLTGPQIEPLNQEAPENNEHPLWSHSGIASALNVKNNHSEPIEALFWLKAVGSQRFFAFDNQTIDHVRSAYKHISTQLQRGEMKFNHSRLFTPEEMTMTLPTPMGLPAVFKISTPMYYSVSGKVNAIPDSQQEHSEMSLLPDLKKATADVHYVVSSKVKAQLMVVTPFDYKRYQAGIERDMQLNFPIRAEFELSREDKEVRAMIQPSNPEQKSKLLTIRNRPYLSQEDMLKLEPAQQHIIHARKPTQTNVTVGQDFTGMAFDIDYSTERQFLDFSEVIRKVQKKEYMSAILKAITEPIQNCELIVSYNPEKSTAKAVTLSAAYEKMKPSQEQQQSEQQDQKQMDEQQEKEIEELLKKEQHETNEESAKDLTEGHSRRQEILKSISQRIKGSQSAVLQLTAKFNGKTEAKFAASAGIANSHVNKYALAVLHLHQNPVNKDDKHIAVYAIGKKSLTPMTNYRKSLEAKHEARLDTVIVMQGKGLSQQADKPAVIRIRSEAKQNEELREHILNSPMAKLCDFQMKEGNNFLPACQNITVPANLMNELVTRVEYRGVSDQVKNATYKAYSFARYLGWEYYTENAMDVNNKENALRIHTRFAPNQQSVNISISAPALNGKFEKIRISPLVAAAAIPHSAYTPGQMVALRLFRDQFYPSCMLDRKAVNTFNNMTYPLEIESSWHVLLHTAYQKPARHMSQLHKNVTILARKVGASEDKKIRVILGSTPHQNNNVVELIPAGKSFEVKVNNQTVQVSTSRVSEFRDQYNQVFARMYLTPFKSIRVIAPKHNVEVLYRPSLTVVSAGNNLRNQVRGLCGTFNGEQATDFSTPKNCIVKRSEDFVASWAVMASGRDQQKQQEAAEAPCFSKTNQFSNIVTEWEEKNSSEESQELRPVPYAAAERPEQECAIFNGIKVMKSDDMICFSLRPLPKCKSHCKSSTKMNQVEFHCVPKDNSNARHWQKMIQRGATLDLAKKPANMVKSVAVPESCQA